MLEDMSIGDIEPAVKQWNIESNTNPLQTFTPLTVMKLSVRILPSPSAVEDSMAVSPAEKSRVTDLDASTVAKAGLVVGPVLYDATASHNLMLPPEAADTT